MDDPHENNVQTNGENVSAYHKGSERSLDSINSPFQIQLYKIHGLLVDSFSIKASRVFVQKCVNTQFKSQQQQQLSTKMSLARVALIYVQALCNHWACTPPNPTPQKGRYHTEELFILQIAPLIFKIHQYLVWSCAIFETLFYLCTLVPFASPLPIPTQTLICPLPSTYPPVHLTPLFVIGVVAVALGTYIRLDCFRTLGQLFTFDLAILPEHTLVTRRFYGYVRHPAYTGSMLVIVGLALSHLSAGAWMTACGPLRIPGTAPLIWALWWAWTVCVGISRAQAEDAEMRKLFKQEWETYATQVPWWFFPGIL